MEESQIRQWSVKQQLSLPKECGYENISKENLPHSLVCWTVKVNRERCTLSKNLLFQPYREARTSTSRYASILDYLTKLTLNLSRRYCGKGLPPRRQMAEAETTEHLHQGRKLRPGSVDPDGL